MVKVAICYGSRYGTTTEIVEGMAKTAETLGAQVEIVELKKSKLSLPLIDYDLVIIGSGIQVGRWTKEPLKFIEKNLDILSKQKVALFVVCAYAANPAQCDMAQKDFLDAIVAKYPNLAPVSTGLFGGMFDFKRYNFATRALVKSLLRKETPEGEEIPEVTDFRNWDHINEWITKLVTS
ncbi:MAG: flavodoxin domain-containing protein [Candidatus Thorarchaeota archaeon]|jgi:menaquinone-dependent protoporphyrinogen oxidase